MLQPHPIFQSCMSVFALAFDFEFPPSNSSFLILIPFKPDGEHLEYFNMPTVRSGKIYLEISKVYNIRV